MWYIVRLDSSRVATPVKVRNATRVSSSDPTRVKSNYIPGLHTSIYYDFTANRTLPIMDGMNINDQFSGISEYFHTLYHIDI